MRERLTTAATLPTDAAAAADTFASRLEKEELERSDVVCAPESSFNLVAAAGMYAGLVMDLAELREPVQVYRTQPADR